MDLREIAPGDTDRACMIGQTGSGKTTLTRFLLDTRKYVVALHPKGFPKDKWQGYKYFSRLESVIKADARKFPRILYAPAYAELSDADTMNEFFLWCYERTNCTVYVDELSAVTSLDYYPAGLGACYMRGRERRVEIWGATQRPARIPQICFTEAEHVYCFFLRGPADRERVEKLADIPREWIQALPKSKHQFYYAPQDRAPMGPLHLRV